jgi:hypothetical protein
MAGNEKGWHCGCPVLTMRHDDWDRSGIWLGAAGASTGGGARGAIRGGRPAGVLGAGACGVLCVRQPGRHGGALDERPGASLRRAFAAGGDRRRALDGFPRGQTPGPDQCRRHLESGFQTRRMDGGFLHGSFRAFAGSKGATTLLWWMANAMRMITTQAAHPFTIHSPHDRSVMPPCTDADRAKIRHGSAHEVLPRPDSIDDRICGGDRRWVFDLVSEPNGGFFPHGSCSGSGSPGHARAPTGRPVIAAPGLAPSFSFTVGKGSEHHRHPGLGKRSSAAPHKGLRIRGFPNGAHPDPSRWRFPLRGNRRGC